MAELDDIGVLRARMERAESEIRAMRGDRERDLELAVKVQRTLFAEPVRHANICADIRHIPMDRVGGDYCQLRFSSPDVCYITISDVTGHGIRAALLATRVSSEVRHWVLEDQSPQDIVRGLNTFVWNHFHTTNLYPSFFVARIDLDEGRLTWSGAGHPSPLLIRHQDAGFTALESQNPLIGVLEDNLASDPQHSIEVAAGDRLLFFTDGLTEANNRQHGHFGLLRLAETVGQARSLDLFKLADHILGTVEEFRDGNITDDICLLVAEIK